jgi:hypothetical protein
LSPALTIAHDRRAGLTLSLAEARCTTPINAVSGRGTGRYDGGMSTARRGRLLALSAVVAACHPAPATQPGASPEGTPSGAAAPPKRCETLEDACVASRGTAARIVDSGWAMKPPDGWTYAQEPTVTIATYQSAALAVTVQQRTPKKAEAVDRDSGIAVVSKRLEVALPKRKIAWQKPDTILDVGELKVSLYQVEDVSRGARKGPLLLFSTKLSKDQVLVGAGFVDENDNANADELILKAIGSLSHQEGTP